MAKRKAAKLRSSTAGQHKQPANTNSCHARTPGPKEGVGSVCRLTGSNGQPLWVKRGPCTMRFSGPAFFFKYLSSIIFTIFTVLQPLPMCKCVFMLLINNISSCLHCGHFCFLQTIYFYLTKERFCTHTHWQAYGSILRENIFSRSLSPSQHYFKPKGHLYPLSACKMHGARRRQRRNKEVGCFATM